MASSVPFILLLSLLAVRARSSTFGFDLHHRFSDKLLHWARSMSPDFPDWPKEGTPEYYSALVGHDHAQLHRRGLTENKQGLTFAAGNETVKIRAFGSLYYVEMSLGTPNVTFLVALDTGSYLTWVPCDCKNCVPTSDFTYRFNSFNSSASSTNKRVSCSSSLCTAPVAAPDSCSGPTDTCPYTARYLDNTTSSGVLLEDVLHLITDDSQQQPVEARITFGCGQNQANTEIPTGLLGLGRRRISIPNTLAAGGFTANSFSMCFGVDRSGRIRFGDKGSPNQRTTPYNSSLALYFVTVTGVLMDNERLNIGFDAIFDTGSSFTLLEGPLFDAFTTTFDRLVKKPKLSTGSNTPFRFCYEIGPNDTEIQIPNIRLTMKGGEVFNLTRPEVYLANSDTNKLVGFCLAVIRTLNITIIGQNFLTGYKVVFDRERNVIGWEETDCYKEVELRASAPTATAPAMAPAPVDAPPSRSTVFRAPSSNSPPPRTGGVSSAPALLKQSLLPVSVLCHLSFIILLMF